MTKFCNYGNGTIINLPRESFVYTLVKKYPFRDMFRLEAKFVNSFGLGLCDSVLDLGWVLMPPLTDPSLYFQIGENPNPSPNPVKVGFLRQLRGGFGWIPAGTSYVVMPIKD